MHPALRIGMWVALAYGVFAAFVIALDRRSRGGGWISLAGMGSFLVTLPVSYLAERWGRRLDHRSDAQMTLAVLGTGALVAALVALIAWPFTG